jgi:hypothetical protein
MLSMYIPITIIPASCRITPSRGKTTEALEESLHKSLVTCIANLWKITLTFIAVIVIFAIRTTDFTAGFKSLLGNGSSMLRTAFGERVLGDDLTCQMKIPFIVAIRPLWYSNLMRESNVDFSLPICMKFSQYLTDTHTTDTAYKETNQMLSMYIPITIIPASCRITPSRGKTTEALEESLHKSLAVNSSLLRFCRTLSMISRKKSLHLLIQ